MNKLLTTLIFAAAGSFAVSGFAADSAPTDHAKPAKQASAKKSAPSSAKHVTAHKSSKGESAPK